MSFLNFSIIKAYVRLLFPTVPENYAGSMLEKRTKRKIVRHLSVGNGSAQLGRYTNKKERVARREAALAHSTH